MKRLSTLTTTTVLLLFLGLGLPAGEALGQAKVKISKEQLVGAWANVSVQVERSDGRKEETFGPNLKGVFIFTADDRYALVLTRPDLPKIASKDRLKGTPRRNIKLWCRAASLILAHTRSTRQKARILSTSRAVRTRIITEPIRYELSLRYRETK